MDVIIEENMQNYFDQLKEVFDEGDFWNHPEAIYNSDETGVPLEPRPPKFIAQKGQKEGPLSDLWSEASDYCDWLCKCYWAVSPFLRNFLQLKIKPHVVQK